MGLEVWLIGSPHEVDAGLSALADAGAIAGASKPEPLYGVDAGRVRRYLRVRIPVPTTTTATGNRSPRKATGAIPTPLALPDAA
jgi:hypothetical protein